MSDNLRRLTAVRSVLRKHRPPALCKRGLRHLDTIASLVAGIVAAGSTHLSQIAARAPDRAKPPSRVKGFARFLQNGRVTQERFFAPFAQGLIERLASEQPLLLVFDGSAVGRGCATLMAGALYGKRALPLTWVTRSGSKGHFTAWDHVALLGQVHALVPEGTRVVFLGDGEFDSVRLQRALEALGWAYVCRTAVSTRIDDGFTACRIGAVSPQAGERYASLPGASMTQQRYGPVHLVVWHEPRYDEPICLVTSLDVAEEAIYYYGHRFQIETLFSDQKSRGFHLHKSHLSDPERLSRLLIAASLAYIWMVYLGAKAVACKAYEAFHRTDRIDLSLFQLGRRWLEYLLNEGKPLLVAFCVPPPGPLQSVR